MTTDLYEYDAMVTIHCEDGIDPYERVTGPEGDEWRATFYDLFDKGDVMRHFAYNAIVNGTTDASRLDGWADLERGQVTFAVEGY